MCAKQEYYLYVFFLITGKDYSSQQHSRSDNREGGATEGYNGAVRGLGAAFPSLIGSTCKRGLSL